MNKEHELPRYRFHPVDPEPYRLLIDEPVFNAASKHLALEKPERTANLQSLGYPPHELEGCF